MRTYFQHPDTGEACGATFDPHRKMLVVTTEAGEEVLRKPVATVRDASRELIRLGVGADEAGFEEA